MLVTILKAIACGALMTGLFLTASAAQDSRTTTTVKDATSPSLPSPRATAGYYVEFRAAQIGAYGHSYAAFGRLKQNGQIASASYADLHPMGNYAVMAFGHLLPVPANTQWDPDVLKLPIASKYRVNLTAAQYQKLLQAVRRARANGAYWNAVSNNCNHFIAELAQAVGLRVPAQFQLSYAFVPALRELNK